MIRAVWLLWLASCAFAADYPRQWFFNAHNCYPKQGQGADRLERARRAGLSAFEVDLAWSEARGRTVVSHSTKLTGSEPTSEEYFFTPMLPVLRALPRRQPGVLLLLDFKSDHSGPVQEVYALLNRDRDLLTTSGRRGDQPWEAPVSWGPLTVILTGDNAAIAKFEQLTPNGEPYLAMGNREPPGREFQQNVASYLPEPATAFYRVFNFEWKHIERDPNPKAGALTKAERARLEALVKTAHQKGYWLRTWTLNATDSFWGTDHDFGSRPALFQRWRACLAAGVESVATDEYELAGEFMRTAAATPPKSRSTR